MGVRATRRPPKKHKFWIFIVCVAKQRVVQNSLFSPLRVSSVREVECQKRWIAYIYMLKVNILGPKFTQNSSKSSFFVCIQAKTSIPGAIFCPKSSKIFIFRLYISKKQHFGCHFVHFFIFLLLCQHFEHI